MSSMCLGYTPRLNRCAGRRFPAAAAAQVTHKIVYGFLPFELVSFGAGLLLFVVVALIASIAPARRALRIDPASAVRYE